MKFAQWHLWAVGLALILLVGLLFRSDRNPEPTPQHEASHDHAPPLSPPPPPVRFDPDCATCPLKAPRAPQGFKRRPSLPAAVEECMEFMIDAAKQGIPNPDTSHLEDCRGWSPLHFAETSQQIQELLDAGADPNIQDLEGRTPLYIQTQKSMMMPSENGRSIVNLLLESGADPWIKTYSDRSVLDIARLGNTSGARLVSIEDRLGRRLEARGTTIEAAIAKNPELKKALDHFRREPQITSEILGSLITTMRQTQPSAQ